ncbi:MAG TPA: peptidoglycan-binding protein [Gaiellaceae bacterium]|nr:peptidoglycan-binding protein [Gaiellaceae bacterium]
MEARPAPAPQAPPRRARRRPAARPAEGPRPVAYLALLAVAVTVAFGVRAVLAGGPDAASPRQEVRPASASPAAVPAAAPAEPQGSPLLRAGRRGGAVADLQVALVALGYFPAHPDAVFGETTGAAVSAFQGAHGLAVDGVAGPETRAALLEALGARIAEDAAVVSAAADAAGAAAPMRAALDATTAASARLSPGKAAVLALVLDDVADAAPSAGEERLAALAGLLEANAAGLEAGPLVLDSGGLADGTGAVYRFFADHGLQFHPLASFARLNQLARDGREQEVRRLAGAMVARGSRAGRTTVWEYGFPFGGPAPWTSGLAQAAGAQALARAATLLSDPALLEEAGRAFRAIPAGLSLPLGGAWIREYSFSDMAVLNAHLQSILSLTEYAELTGDEQARGFVARLTEAAGTLVGEFDTGCWSLYSHGGSPASPAYHDYHVRLARRLARSEGGVWRETAARWDGYRRAGGC